MVFVCCLLQSRSKLSLSDIFFTFSLTTMLQAFFSYTSQQLLTVKLKMMVYRKKCLNAHRRQSPNLFLFRLKFLKEHIIKYNKKYMCIIFFPRMPRNLFPFDIFNSFLSFLFAKQSQKINSIKCFVCCWLYFTRFLFYLRTRELKKINVFSLK